MANDSADRFSGLELDSGPRRPRPAPTVAPAPAETPGETIRPAARAAAESEAAMVSSVLGIEHQATLYALGTKMLPMGEDRARQLRTEWESRPLVGVGADEFSAVIAAERRADRVAPLSEYRLDHEGYLARPGVDGRLRISDRAWSQIMLAGRAQAGAPSSSAAGNLNRWLGRAESPMLLRTRRPHSETKSRDLFAVLSKRYAPLDVDRIARSVAAVAPRDSRLVTRYDGRRTELDVSLAAPHDVGDGSLGVGRLHRVGLRITSADDGSEAIQVRIYAERIACINCTILADERVTLDRKHIGRVDVIRGLVIDAIGQASSAIGNFGALWSEANKARIHAAYDGTATTAGEIFRRLTHGAYVTVPGYSADELTALLEREWEHEPGDTIASVHNAVTRLAHSGEWSSPWVTDDLESKAGELLYQRAYFALPEVEASE